MKKCFYCAEQIQDEAIKCRYCGERSDAGPPPAGSRPNPSGVALDGSTFTGAIRSGLTKYADASGRAARAEFWRYWLFVLLVTFAVGAFSPELAGLVLLGLLLPNICVTIRRLHDVGRSGAHILWPLVPVIGGLYLVVLLVHTGEPRPNRFGEPPQGTPHDASAGWTPPLGGLQAAVWVTMGTLGLAGMFFLLSRDPVDGRAPSRQAVTRRSAQPPAAPQTCPSGSGEWNLCPAEADVFETYVGLWASIDEDRLSIAEDGYVILETGDLKNVDPGSARLARDRVVLEVYGYKKLIARAISNETEIALLITAGACTQAADPTECGLIFRYVDVENVLPWNSDIIVQPSEAFMAANYVGRWALYPIETSIDIDIGSGGDFRVAFDSGEAGERVFVGTWTMEGGFLRLNADGLSPSTVVLVSSPFLPGNPLSLLFNTDDCGPLELQCGQVLESFGESEL